MMLSIKRLFIPLVAGSMVLVFSACEPSVSHVPQTNQSHVTTDAATNSIPTTDELIIESPNAIHSNTAPTTSGSIVSSNNKSKQTVTQRTTSTAKKPAARSNFTTKTVPPVTSLLSTSSSKTKLTSITTTQAPPYPIPQKGRKFSIDQLSDEDRANILQAGRYKDPYIIGYYGDYHGVKVASLAYNSIHTTPGLISTQVGEFVFIFRSPLHMFVVCKGSSGYTLGEAYENGILNLGDIQELYNNYYEGDELVQYIGEFYKKP